MATNKRASETRPDFRVIQAQRDGLPALIVIDAGLKTTRREDYPWLVTISIPIATPNAKGLCDQAELDRLAALEDQLLAALDPADHRYMGRTMWNGIRDVFLYVKDADRAVQMLQARGQELPGAGFALARRHDPDWREYYKFPV